MLKTNLEGAMPKTVMSSILVIAILLASFVEKFCVALFKGKRKSFLMPRAQAAFLLAREASAWTLKLMTFQLYLAFGYP